MKRLVWFYRISSVSLFTLGLIGLLGSADFRINLTPSELLGLWRIVKPDRRILVGDLVFICPPENLKEQRLNSDLPGYAPHGYGVRTAAVLPSLDPKALHS